MKKINLFLIMVLTVTMSFGQGFSSFGPIKSKNQNNTDQNRGVTDLTCDGSSLFANDFVNVNSLLFCDGPTVDGADFSTVGGTIETLKLWGITAVYTSSGPVPCMESSPLILDVAFYKNRTYWENNDPLYFFNDIEAYETPTMESYDGIGVNEYDDTFPEDVLLSSGIITITASNEGNVDDCDFYWITSSTGYGIVYQSYEGTIYDFPDYKFTFCLGGTPASCPRPWYMQASNLNDVSVDIEFVESGLATSWEYGYGVDDFVPCGAGISITSETVALTDLLPNTEYKFYVRAVCGEGDYSEWSDAFSFKTMMCAPELQCAYEFDVQDGIGMGWAGAYISVVADGSEIAQVTNLTGVLETQTLPICNASDIELVWYGGMVDDAISFVIRDAFGEEIYSVSDASTLQYGSVFYSFVSSCMEDVADLSTELISIYPNPTSGGVFITNIENATVQVYNMVGAVVLCEKNVNNFINLKGLPKGTYLVKIENDNLSTVKKLTLIE
ncbi:MAG: T9SS type A sorting domain-containing protein [Bacteroidales bacterium]|nr:T9SS type A sorting domain-containing protein [Bacteroidales bacterium]